MTKGCVCFFSFSTELAKGCPSVLWDLVLSCDLFWSDLTINYWNMYILQLCLSTHSVPFYWLFYWLYNTSCLVTLILLVYIIRLFVNSGNNKSNIVCSHLSLYANCYVYKHTSNFYDIEEEFESQKEWTICPVFHDNNWWRHDSKLVTFVPKDWWVLTLMRLHLILLPYCML